MMTNLQASHRPSEQGFTLVELAIVMVIIGILIGGILKGQELIATAKISSTVGQIEGLDAGLNTFEEKYQARPGDMLTPNVRLPSCAVAPCSTAGDGDSRIENGAVLGVAPANNQESTTAFTHLSAADLISGIRTTGSSATFGNMLPIVKAGGGMWIGYAVNATGTGITTLTGGRHYAILNGSPIAVGNNTGALSPATAAQIDRKIDDGIGNTGGTQVAGAGCATAGVYQEQSTTVTCALYSRVLN